MQQQGAVQRQLRERRQLQQQRQQQQAPAMAPPPMHSLACIRPRQEQLVKQLPRRLPVGELMALQLQLGASSTTLTTMTHSSSRSGGAASRARGQASAAGLQPWQQQVTMQTARHHSRWKQTT
jgi:hypothetical protein